MSTRDEAWPPGTPAWVDLMVDDAGAASEFYRALFGWEVAEGTPESGGYRLAYLRDRAVAGIGQKPQGQDMPSVWTTYLSVDDVDRTVERVQAGGGQVMMPPTDVLDRGRMAIVADPAGAAFGLWQAGGSIGAGLVNETGAMCWNECMSRDYDAALSFYRETFGYDYQDISEGESFRYSVFSVNGQEAGGIGALGADLPPQVPSHWMAYFAVDDTDATTAAATERGAKVQIGPMDTPHGRMAVVEGPQAEIFSVIQPPPSGE